MHWTELRLLGTRVRVNTPSGMANTSPLAFMASHVYAPWSPSFTSRIVSVPRPFSLVILILQSKAARKREHKRKRLFELDLLNIGYDLKAKLSDVKTACQNPIKRPPPPRLRGVR